MVIVGRATEGMRAGHIGASPYAHREVLNVWPPLVRSLWEWVVMGGEIDTMFAATLSLQAPLPKP